MVQSGGIDVESAAADRRDAVADSNSSQTSAKVSVYPSPSFERDFINSSASPTYVLGPKKPPCAFIRQCVAIRQTRIITFT